VPQQSPRALKKEQTTVTMRPVAGTPLLSSSISFGMTLLMAIACGVAVANIYYNQPMLGIMEAALSVLAAQLVKILPAKTLPFPEFSCVAGASGDRGEASMLRGPIPSTKTRLAYGSRNGARRCNVRLRRSHYLRTSKRHPPDGD
jgi:hypothetical protein